MEKDGLSQVHSGIFDLCCAEKLGTQSEHFILLLHTDVYPPNNHILWLYENVVPIYLLFPFI